MLDTHFKFARRGKFEMSERLGVFLLRFFEEFSGLGEWLVLEIF